jgi:hypothetical protein
MRVTYEACANHLEQVARLLEQCGVVLSKPADGEDLELTEDDAGALNYELGGELPDGDSPALARIEVREEFKHVGSDLYERTSYEHELLDKARNYRRAFHLHFPEAFVRAYQVVLHEHCERPIKTVNCHHYEGAPIKDAFAGVRAPMGGWTVEASDCRRLRCLDGGRPGIRRGSRLQRTRKTTRTKGRRS